MFVRVVFLLLLLFPFTLWAVPVASYNAETNVSYSVSDASLDVEASSFFFDDFTDTVGSGVANATGSGDAGPSSDPAFSWFTTANGEVSELGGLADSYSLIDGELIVSNSSDSSIDATISFSAELFVEIFTDNPAFDWSLAFSSLYIEDDSGATVFDDFIELDTLFDGAGAISNNLLATVDVSVSLAAGESVSYFLALDAAGTAESLRQPVQVPAPTAFILMGLGLAAMGFTRRKKQA